MVNRGEEAVSDTSRGIVTPANLRSYGSLRSDKSVFDGCADRIEALERELAEAWKIAHSRSAEIERLVDEAGRAESALLLARQGERERIAKMLEDESEDGWLGVRPRAYADMLVRRVRALTDGEAITEDERAMGEHAYNAGLSKGTT